MTPRRLNSPRDRTVGGWLRTLREERHISSATVARKFGWSASKLSRLETGRNRVSVVDAASLLGHYQVAVEQREEVLSLAEPVDELTCWWERNIPSRGPRATLPFHETDATMIVQWSPNAIPEPLWAPGRALAIFQAQGVAKNDRPLHLRTHALITRKATCPTVPYVVYLGVTALRTPITPESHSNHFRHLLNLSHKIAIRIVRQPMAHHGLDHGWTTLHYSRTQQVVRIDLLGSAVYLSRDAARPYLET